MRCKTVSALARNYLDFAPLRPVTRKQTGYHLKTLLLEFGRRKPEKMTCADITAYYEKWLAKGLSISTIATRIRIFKAIFSWGMKSGRIKLNPLEAYRLPHCRKRQIAPPNQEELRDMLNFCSSHIERVIQIGWHLGPRIGPSELFNLQWRDVDFTTGVIRMPNAAKGCGSETRILPLPQILADKMRVWKDGDSSCPWVINWRGQKVKSANKAFDSAKRKAGIMRKITPYSLRHAFATQSIANGAPLKGVCAIMGHSSPRMVLEVYQHLDFCIMGQCVEKVPML